MSAPDDALAVRFFDGRHSRPHGALLRVNAGMLTVVPDDSATPPSVLLSASFTNSLRSGPMPGAAFGSDLESLICQSFRAESVSLRHDRVIYQRLV